jgi:hypothetical protein
MYRALCFSILLLASIPSASAQGTASAVISPSASSSEGQLIARPAWATSERLRGRVDGATPIESGPFRVLRRQTERG